MSEIIEGKPVLEPGMCFICEMSNPVRYLDTFRDFAGIVKERIDGRKYLCEECIEEGATKLGFITPKDAAKQASAIAALEEAVAALEKDIKHFADLKAVIDHFGGPKAAKVAVAKKA